MGEVKNLLLGSRRWEMSTGHNTSNAFTLLFCPCKFSLCLIHRVGNVYLLCMDNHPFFRPQLILHKEHCIICYSYIELYSSASACTSHRL